MIRDERVVIRVVPEHASGARTDGGRPRGGAPGRRETVARVSLIGCSGPPW